MSSFVFLALGLALAGAPAASSSAKLRARIAGASGSPVSGAALYVYRSSNTRQPADFISPKTGADGRCALSLPAGKYWVVARLRQSDRYGPLRVGDKQSGAPEALELSPGSASDLELVVRDLREATQPKRIRPDLFVLEGTITSNGHPAADRYLCVWRGEEHKAIPDFVSAWTGPDGQYRLSLPAGHYELGVSARFPAEGSEPLLRRIDLTADLHSVDLGIAAAAADGG